MRFLHLHQLLLLSLLALLAVSCIGESFESCVQYAVTAKPVDPNGNQLPDSVLGHLKAYLFLDGKFDHTVTAEPDGRFLISFDKNGSASLVGVGLSSVDSAEVHTPQYGDDIASLSVSVLKDSVTNGYTLPSRIFYGNYKYAAASSRAESSVDTTFVMSNQKASIHVVVKQLTDFFGESSNYQIVLSGFRSSMSYSGEPTGDLIEYRPSASFNSLKYFVSEAVNVFPLKSGDTVAVSIYRGSTLIWYSEKTETGNAITISAGDDKAIIVDCGRKDLTLSVMAWNDFLQKIVFP